jgi:hypothetical protein
MQHRPLLDLDPHFIYHVIRPPHSNFPPPQSTPPRDLSLIMDLPSIPTLLLPAQGRRARVGGSYRVRSRTSHRADYPASDETERGGKEGESVSKVGLEGKV